MSENVVFFRPLRWNGGKTFTRASRPSLPFRNVRDHKGARDLLPTALSERGKALQEGEVLDGGPGRSERRLCRRCRCRRCRLDNSSAGRRLHRRGGGALRSLESRSHPTGWRVTCVCAILRGREGWYRGARARRGGWGRRWEGSERVRSSRLQQKKVWELWRKQKEEEKTCLGRVVATLHHCKFFS